MGDGAMHSERRSSLEQARPRPGGQRAALGLALAGGVFRGRAHLGVILALEEAGISVDYVSGVSAGAIAGACYAAGLDGAELVRVSRDFSWLRIARLAALNPFRTGLARLGLLDFYNLELELIRVIGDVTFDELPRPFAVGATDLLSGEQVVITSGRVAKAVRASSSVPGFVIPTRWRDRVLCDGFASNNVPIQVLRDMGADVVLAVNVMPAPMRLPSSFLWAGSLAISHLVLRAGDPLSLADLVVEPDVSESSYVAAGMDDMIRRGREAMEPLIPDVKALLS